MKNIKTYEGFFDFFKKKNYEPISIRHLLDCLLPLTDNDKIKSELSGDRLSGIFPSDSYVFKNTSSYDSDYEKFMNDILRDAGLINHSLDIRGNVIAFKIQYSPVEVRRNYPMNYYYNGVEFGAISDDEVNSIMKECQETLEGFDCQMTFFIGRGMSEGRAWDTEFSDINKMVNKTVKNVKYGSNVNCIRNIIVKIKALGGIEE